MRAVQIQKQGQRQGRRHRAKGRACAIKIMHTHQRYDDRSGGAWERARSFVPPWVTLRLARLVSADALSFLSPFSALLVSAAAAAFFRQDMDLLKQYIPTARVTAHVTHSPKPMSSQHSLAHCQRTNPLAHLFEKHWTTAVG